VGIKTTTSRIGQNVRYEFNYSSTAPWTTLIYHETNCKISYVGLSDMVLKICHIDERLPIGCPCECRTKLDHAVH